MHRHTRIRRQRGGGGGRESNDDRRVTEMAGCQFRRTLVWKWRVICDRGGRRLPSIVFSGAQEKRPPCARPPSAALPVDSNNEVILAREIDGNKQASGR